MGKIGRDTMGINKLFNKLIFSNIGYQYQFILFALFKYFEFPKYLYQFYSKKIGTVMIYLVLVRIYWFEIYLSNPRKDLPK